MWNYTKCTAKDRIEKLNRLTDAFHEEADCLESVSYTHLDVYKRQVGHCSSAVSFGPVCC